MILKERIMNLQRELILFNKFLNDFLLAENTKEHKKPVPEKAIADLFKKCCDSFTLLVKDYIEKDHGVINNSNKTIYNRALEVGLITKEQTNLLLKMLDDRETINHATGKDFSILVDSLVQYCTIMNTITNKMDPKK